MRAITPRGYTGHEYVDGTGVIHMNGRIYDSELGRFLQADPVIQAPTNTQSWNAYTYVFNNPFAYTDPTGMISWRQVLGIVIVVVAAVTQQYWAINAAAKFWGTVAVGALAGGVSTGTWQGALWGAFSAAAFYGVGSYFEGAKWAQATDTSNIFGSGLNAAGYGSKVLAHGVTGGVMSKLQGGKFGHGFASAGVTQAFAPGIAKVGNPAARVVLASIVGGTASKLSGGKFGNGAITAAFAEAFNDLLHGATEDTEIGKAVHNQIYFNEEFASSEFVTRGWVGDMGVGDGFTDLVVGNKIYEIKPWSYAESGYKYTQALDQVQGYVNSASGQYRRGDSSALMGSRNFFIQRKGLVFISTYSIEVMNDPHNSNSGLVFYKKTLMSRKLNYVPVQGPVVAPLPGGSGNNDRRPMLCPRPGRCF